MLIVIIYGLIKMMKIVNTGEKIYNFEFIVLGIMIKNYNDSTRKKLYSCINRKHNNDLYSKL